MLHLPTVKENLGLYIDAGFPILYICTYEEANADKCIAAAAGNMEVLEWNGANCGVNFKTKAPDDFNRSLEATLLILKRGKELNRKLLVIKDAADQLKSPKVIALLKEIARKIRKEDIEATIIIVSPILCIPPELEKLITVLELGLPDETEISHIIEQFAADKNISCGPVEFRSELAIKQRPLIEKVARNAGHAAKYFALGGPVIGAWAVHKAVANEGPEIVQKDTGGGWVHIQMELDQDMEDDLRRRILYEPDPDTSFDSFNHSDLGDIFRTFFHGDDSKGGDIHVPKETEEDPC